MTRYGPLFLLLCLPVFAAVDGTVINRTTSKPQAGATVTLYKLGQAGMESIESVKSDASGKFTINQTPRGPHLIQTAYDGVTYNHMLPPGRPSSGLTLDVYAASRKQGAARVDKHFVLFEPKGSELAVSENFLFLNDGKTTYNDSDNGTLRIYVPPGGTKTLVVQATAPQGMPIRRAAEKTKQPDVYYIDFPIKPGQSTIQANYTLPFSTPGRFEGRVLHKGGLTSLIAPDGVTLKGDGIEEKGQEPRSKARVYQVRGDSYKIDIEGSGVLKSPEGPESGSEGPSVSQIMPGLYTKVPVNALKVSAFYWVIALAAGILAAGFALLWRAQPTGSPPASTAPAKGKK